MKSRKKTQKCKEFTWGGCGGSVPFETKADCLKAKCDPAPCLLEPKQGPCEAAIPKWYYDKKKGVSGCFRTPVLSVWAFKANKELIHP